MKPRNMTKDNQTNSKHPETGALCTVHEGKESNRDVAAVRSAVRFYRKVTKRADVRAILEDLSKL